MKTKALLLRKIGILSLSLLLSAGVSMFVSKDTKASSGAGIDKEAALAKGAYTLPSDCIQVRDYFDKTKKTTVCKGDGVARIIMIGNIHTCWNCEQTMKNAVKFAKEGTEDKVEVLFLQLDDADDDVLKASLPDDMPKNCFFVKDNIAAWETNSPFYSIYHNINTVAHGGTYSYSFTTPLTGFYSAKGELCSAYSGNLDYNEIENRFEGCNVTLAGKAPVTSDLAIVDITDDGEGKTYIDLEATIRDQGSQITGYQICYKPENNGSPEYRQATVQGNKITYRWETITGKNMNFTLYAGVSGNEHKYQLSSINYKAPAYKMPVVEEDKVIRNYSKDDTGPNFFEFTGYISDPGNGYDNEFYFVISSAGELDPYEDVSYKATVERNVITCKVPIPDRKIYHLGLYLKNSYGDPDSVSYNLLFYYDVVWPDATPTPVAKPSLTPTVTPMPSDDQYDDYMDDNTDISLNFDRTAITAMVCGDEIELSVNTDKAGNIKWTTSDTRVASVSSSGKVTAKMAGSVTITASQGDKDAQCVIQVLYKDVKDSSKFWFEPTNFLTNHGIVKGYNKQTKFKPANECTRAQMVTFIWRLMGEPEPETKKCKFSDVKKSDYFYKACLWGNENHIVEGYKDGTFGPKIVCARRHAVTFLWRLAKTPEPISKKNKFSDVKKSDYFYKATLWASENGILAGYSDGTFRPDGDCLRRQMVTFLYKYDMKINYQS